MWRWLGPFGILFWVFSTGAARAQDVPDVAPVDADAPAAAVEGDVALSYRRGKGAEQCPDEDAFRNRTLDLFGLVDPFVATGQAAGVQVRIELSRAPSQAFQASVTLIGAAGKPLGSPSFDQHQSCDALVWRLAHAMGATILRRPPAPCPAQPACPSCPRCPVAQPEVVHDCDEKCIEKIKNDLCAQYGLCMDPTVLTVMAGGLVTAGWTLDAGPGAMLGAEVRRDWFSVGVEARGFFPAAAQRYYVGPTSDLVRFSGLLVPCARWKWLLGCAFVEAGTFVFTVPYGSKGDNSRFLLAFGPRGAVDVPLAQGFSLRGTVDLAIQPLRYGESVTDFSDPAVPTLSWRLPVVSGFFGIGVAWSK